MKYPCPQCSRAFDLHSSRLGEEVECPNCLAVFVVRAFADWTPEGGYTPAREEITAAAHTPAPEDDPTAPAETSPAKRIRFRPLHCPSCGDAVACGYSRYRNARHRLYRPLLLAGVAATVAAALLAVLAAAQLTASVLDGRGFREMESGAIFFAALAAATAFVWAGARLWWQALHRLPRRFEYECATCGWKGPCEVIGLR